MEEYCQLGHMSQVKSDPYETGFFLPHHGTLNKKNQETKFRVVFETAFTVSGVSLNNIHCVGPTIQNDLTFTISAVYT